jgi:DNA repair photolyase
MPLKTLTGRYADARKGRGAGINPEGRFEKVLREAFDDGWPQPPAAGEAGERGEADSSLLPLRTHVTVEYAKSIISRNDSPDIPFTQSINPYQGCEHGCIYCLSGDTPILMADGRLRPLADVRTGDMLYGTVRRGWYRRYVKTRVLAHWSTIKPAYRITLEDGTSLIAGPDHRFLTERGWKFVTGAMGRGAAQRPYLTTNNKLMGSGAFAPLPAKDRDYQLGYLCGLVRGGGHLASYHYQRSGRVHGDQHQFRLALCDTQALQQAQEYLRDCQIATQEFVFQRAAHGRRIMHAIRTHARPDVEQIRALIAWPAVPSPRWGAGFLAGIFDAEGSYSQGILRISNTDESIIDWIGRCLRTLNFRFVLEHVRRQQSRPVTVVRLVGGLREHLRFFHSVDPAITRKRDIVDQAVKSDARLRVASIEPLGRALRLYDITTETGDFIANGVVSHNCYARPSHAYRNLSPGIDFETRLFAKGNAPELLRNELSRPGYRCEVISLGANTDPYQPIEREYRITRGILEVCAEFGQPVGIVTKNALVERDIDILATMAQKHLVNVFVSCNNLDHGLARRLEPRCTAPARRLQAMRRLSEAGIPVGVLVAPVIPFLTDHQIESVLEAAWAHGARQAGYVLMRLPWELKDLFREWLERNYPLKARHVMSRVHQMRDGRDNDPNFGSRMRGTGELAELLGQRFRFACRRLGFNAEKRNCALSTAQFQVPGRQQQMPLF